MQNKMIHLDFIQSCVRREISNDDLAYLVKWAMVDYKNTDFLTFLIKVEEMLEIKFFDNNRIIYEIVNHYRISIESQLNSLENQSNEC
jgi:hypothetical protein